MPNSSVSSDPTTQLGGARPLTTRSVLLSTLLGTEPPELPVAVLVRAGSLFGVAEGSVRTALSRMRSRGDVTVSARGWYRLGPSLVERQRRQRFSREPSRGEWNGTWRVGVVTTGSSSQLERSAFRSAMQRARFAEQREGVWLRPSNLYQEDFEGSEAGSRCYWYSAYPTRSDTELAGALWDLEEWTATANSLRAQIRPIARRLREEDLSALPEGFEASAAVLRHLLADPLLPEELLDRSWPGTALRREYAKFDELYRLLLGSWFRMGR